jgi:predicted TIM-barrel fold metal-dependent hydrolase
MAAEIKAIDVLVIPNPVGAGPGAEAGLASMFPGLKERGTKGSTAEDYIKDMDEAGVERGILAIQDPADKKWVMDTIKKYPKRFIPSMVVNPVARGILNEIKRIREYVKECGVQMIRLGCWRMRIPINDRLLFPFYALAAESGLRVQVNVGLPGPIAPGWVQDPIYVDDVCFNFPELTIIQTHTGMPWIETACNNVIKWPNCYLATTSYRPKYFPPALIQHLNTRAQDKIVWGTEYPIVLFKQSLDDIKELPLRDNVRPKYLRENALKLFKWA